MARYISAKTHVGSITTTSQLGMASHISARNGRVHLGQDTCWQHHNHIPARNGRVHPVQEWSGTSRPRHMLVASQPHPSQEWSGTSRLGMARYILAYHTLSFLYTRFYTFQPLVSLRSLRDWGGWSWCMAGYIPAQ